MENESLREESRLVLSNGHFGQGLYREGYGLER